VLWLLAMINDGARRCRHTCAFAIITNANSCAYELYTVFTVDKLSVRAEHMSQPQAGRGCGASRLAGEVRGPYTAPGLTQYCRSVKHFEERGIR
jgi:hypothetical protein